MGIEMGGLAPGGFDEALDLQTPFRFDFVQLEIGKVLNERGVFEEVPIRIHNG